MKNIGSKLNGATIIKDEKNEVIFVNNKNDNPVIVEDNTNIKFIEEDVSAKPIIVEEINISKDSKKSTKNNNKINANDSQEDAELTF